MSKLLFVGDAGCPSGFARATHEILDHVRFEHDVTVLGVNYRGDPHNYPYPIYAAAAGEDSLGVGRLVWMCKRVQPDVIIIQSDGWFFPYYVAALRKRKPSGEYVTPEFAAIPIIGAIAVDGKNFRGEWIKDLTLAIFWTQFGLNEARIGGYAGPAKVIPLGVDQTMFYPVAREGALHRKKIDMLKDKFIVGNVNRNQWRKRWDLTLKYYSEWVRSRNVKDAQLFLHTAPTGDDNVNVFQLAKYYGITDQLALNQPEIFYGDTDEDMRDTYNCFDVAISTTQGEGMGLTAMEAMACGVPCILPEWSALGDWAKGAASMIPCTTTAMQSFTSVNGCAVIGGVPDERVFIEALDLHYRDKDHRKLVGDIGRNRVLEDRFTWRDIGEKWIEAIDSVLQEPEVHNDEVWQEVKKVKTTEVPA